MAHGQQRRPMVGPAIHSMLGFVFGPIMPIEPAMKSPAILAATLMTVVAFQTTWAAPRQEPATDHTTIELWPGGLPADAKPVSAETIATAKKKAAEEKLPNRFYYVDTPTLTVFEPPADKKTDLAMVVCPGGGYYMLAFQHEGIDMGKWLADLGITTFVLKYRVPRRDPVNVHWEPMQDVQRAIRIVRSKATDYKFDPEKLGVLGFSAGGHLTVMAGTQYETQSYPAVDDADKLSCKPNFICPIYAAYLADGYRDDVVELGELIKVTKDTPPTFLAATWDDKMRGAQSALLFARLKKYNVPAEIHMWQKGGHGYGLYKNDQPSDGWEEHLKVWLKTNGYLK